jgi:hypothetical protein
LKPREERRNVVLEARLRGDRGWGQACILNLSSRGLLVYSDAPANPGSYVEIRRGEPVIVARVVWRRSNRIGLSSREKLQLGEMVSGTAASAGLQLTASNLAVERRKLSREDQSRLRARRGQFAAIAAFGACLAGLSYVAATAILTPAMSKVTAALHVP